MFQITNLEAYVYVVSGMLFSAFSEGIELRADVVKSYRYTLPLLKHWGLK